MASSSPPRQAVEPQRQVELYVNDLQHTTTTNADNPRPNTPKQLSLTTSTTTALVVDKSLSSTANLAQLLPTGTVLAFESLSSSFTNNGMCSATNQSLTAVLIYFCLMACVIFTFTDSLMGLDGKLYYGIATFKGFYVFNFTGTDEEAAQTFHDLEKFRIRMVDYVHAIFTAIVFLSVAFSDTGVQNCYFRTSGNDTKQLLINLPLGAAALSSFVFLIFPTTRKGIGFTNVTHNS